MRHARWEPATQASAEHSDPDGDPKGKRKVAAKRGDSECGLDSYKDEDVEQYPRYAGRDVCIRRPSASTEEQDRERKRRGQVQRDRGVLDRLYVALGPVFA